MNKVLDKNWKLAIIALICSIIPIIYAPMIDMTFIILGFFASFAAWKIVSILYMLESKSIEWGNKTMMVLCQMIIITCLFFGMLETYKHTGHLFYPTWKWGTETHSAFAWKLDNTE